MNKKKRKPMKKGTKTILILLALFLLLIAGIIYIVMSGMAFDTLPS